jgi:hypothetical protein
MSKLIVNQDVLLRTPIIQDAVCCYHERYEEKKKQTVQTKLSMFLIKKTSPTSTQEHGRAIAQAVSRQLSIAAARVQTRVWSCGIL